MGKNLLLHYRDYPGNQYFILIKNKAKILPQISPDRRFTCRLSLFRVTYYFRCFKVHSCAAINTCTLMQRITYGTVDMSCNTRRNPSATVIIHPDFSGSAYRAETLKSRLINGSPLPTNALKAPNDPVYT